MRIQRPSRPRLATMSLILLLLLISTASWASEEGPTSAEYGAVLNLSGKQRMLSQKMSKEILLIALDVDKDGNLNNLEQTSALFDKTLKGLRDGSEELGLPPTTSGRILRQLDKIDAIWAEFHPTVREIIAAKGVTPEQVATVAKTNLPLLKEMNKAVGQYEKAAQEGGLKADPALASTINLAGKQRMLTQKMSKEFLLVAYGHEPDDNKLALLETYSLFERTLKGLLDGDETLGLPGTQEQAIRDQLKVVDGLWSTLKPIVEYGADYKTSEISRDKIEALANANPPLLREMNKAVGLYEQEAAKE